MDTITIMMGRLHSAGPRRPLARLPSKGQYGVKTLQGLQQLILL